MMSFVAPLAPARLERMTGVSAMLKRRVLNNSAWLIGDKVLRLGLGLVVTVWLARHFGPEAFGVWNYAIAFVALFGAVATLGMDGVVVRELVRDGADAGAILGTATSMRLATSAALGAAATLSMYWIREDGWLPTLLVALNAAALVFQASQVLDFHFQARMHSRPAVIATNMAYVAAMLVRLALLAGNARIEWLGATLVLEAALAAYLLWRAWRTDTAVRPHWHWHTPTARLLLRESWPLILSSLAVIVYMRVDQIMLASMAGDLEVGQFSAALRIAEVWYFIPMSVATAAFPLMMKRRGESAEAYERIVQTLYDGMAWLGLIVATLTTLLAPWLVDLLYGGAYHHAADVLTVQIWAGIIVSMSFVHSRWLLAEGLQWYGLVYTLCGAALNVGLNLWLIPRMGAVGAAWATLATQTCLMPLQLLFPKARRNLLLMLRTVGAPLRYLPR